MMAELKTKKNDASVADFLNAVEKDQKRADAWTILEMMKEITGDEPAMWGDSIVGFGTYHYHYATGREGDWMVVGFSPRKRNLSLYIMSGFSEFEELLAKLGKHKTGVGCLYINKLGDIDMDVLREIVTKSVAFMRQNNAPS